MKILIISQHLFPMQTPRAHRTTELVKELGKRGYDVTLYAVLGNFDYSSFEKEYSVKIKKIPIYYQKHPYNSDSDGKRTIIDKIFGKILGKILEFPNIEFIFRVSNIIKREEKQDVLITIADPHQIHWGAAKAKEKHLALFPKVWIADCGDPFMANGKNKNHLSYFSYFEKKFSKSCDYITVPIEEAKEGYYKEYRNKIKIISQGFEFDLTKKRITPNNEIITFAYAGTFYKGIRNPSVFLDFIADLDINFKFIVYTMYTELIEPYMKKLGEKLEIRKPLQRDQLIKELEKMDFVLNIDNINTNTQIPSKLIDYAISGTPILSINPIQLDEKNIYAFFNKDYSKQHIVKNIESYHIASVTEKFIALFN